jgi:hypothetical protein
VPSVAPTVRGPADVPDFVQVGHPGQVDQRVDFGTLAPRHFEQEVGATGNDFRPSLPVGQDGQRFLDRSRGEIPFDPQPVGLDGVQLHSSPPLL